MKLDLPQLASYLFSSAATRRPAVIFDLDSTLFSVGPRTQHILRELGREVSFRSRFKDLAHQLERVEIGPREYSVRQILRRLRPQAAEDPELVDLVRTYWRDHFFASHHLDKDELYPAAREFVTQLHGWGLPILYLTGRPEKAMREGTERALKTMGFPPYAPSDLLMKPEESETDEHFKVVELKRLLGVYDEIWFFENEPLIIQDVRLLVPEVNLVFVDSVHAGKAEAPKDLVWIVPDYRPGLIKKENAGS